MCCVHVHGSLSCMEWVFLIEYLYFEVEYALLRAYTCTCRFIVIGYTMTQNNCVVNSFVHVNNSLCNINSGDVYGLDLISLLALLVRPGPNIREYFF